MWRTWKLVLIFFPQYGFFFPIRFTFYGILIICEIHGFLHQFPMAWENAVKSIELGEPRKLIFIFSLTYGYFSSIRFPFMVYFVTRWEMHGFPHQNPLCVLSGYFSTVLFFLLVPKSIDSLKEKTEKTDKVNYFFKKRKTNFRHTGIQSKIYQKKKRE